MKKLLPLSLVVLGIAVLLGAGVLGITHYNKQPTKDDEIASLQKELQVKDEVLKTEKQRNADLIYKHEMVRVECEKGKSVHNRIPAYLQRTLPMPTCGPAIVQ